MTRFERLVESLTSTAKINPDEYAMKTSRNRVDSLGYALAGWLYMLRWQRNTWLMGAATPIVIALAAWLRVSLTGWALLSISITIVWLTEFMNAAVEASIDLTTSEFHPMAKVGKDVAAAAVLLGVVNSVIVGLLVMGPPLWAKVTGWFF
ncbi:MAG: diacylglycerol kinase family protein [Chloroflexota bacterium]